MESLNHIKPLELDAEETVSQAVGRLIKNNKTAAIVNEKGKFKGILTINSLAIHDISEPDKTKIKNYIEKITPIPPGTNMSELAHSVLINNHSAIPVSSENNIYILTQLDILSMFKNESYTKDKKAKDIMSFPYCIKSTDTLASTKAVLRELHISHIPVVDEKDKIEGLVDKEILLKSIVQKSRPTRGEESGEKIRTDQIPISSFMKKPVLISKNSGAKEIIETMIKYNTTAVLIEDRGKIDGIITTKDLLKLIGEAVEGVYVRISGLQEEEDFVKAVVDSEIERFVKKISKIYRINYLVLHVVKHNIGGKRVKYSIRSTLFSNRGTFFAQAHDWDVTKTVKHLLNSLEKMVIKKKEKLTN